MTDILVKFDEPITAPNGETFFAQASGREVTGGLWEGWLEFVPVRDGIATLDSGRETTQPNRMNLEYWAQGLTKVYLEGALARALAHASGGYASAPSETMNFGGASRRGTAPTPRRAPLSSRPILDPFEVYSQGEGILRSELGALSRDHLQAIVSAYNFKGPESGDDSQSRGNAAMVEAIVEGVRSSG
jgi:hypothetical protein